nr:insulinase family protein [Pseudomonadota bacterium]
YVQAVMELPALAEDLLDLLPLYCALVTEVGSAGRDYLATQARQAAVTGGLSARCVVRGAVDDPQRTQGVLALAGKALARNQAALAALLAETFFTPRFDELPRLRELVAQLRAAREESVTDQGHYLAMAAASAGLSPTAALSHRWDGLLGLRRLKALDDALDDPEQLAAFAAALQALHGQIQRAPRRLLVVSEAARQEAIAAALAGHWLDSPQADGAFAPPPAQSPRRQGWSTGTQVSFCAKAYPAVAPGHGDAPALAVLGNFLRDGYLHRAIREQGGAYGGGAGYQGDTGVFRFYSYRDPRLAETLADFDRALDWLRDTRHPPRALEEAILGMVAAIDRPGSPAGEAIGTYFASLFGRTPAQRRAFRQAVLKVTLDDLRRVAEVWLRPERARVAVVSNAQSLHRQPGLEVQAL